MTRNECMGFVDAWLRGGQTSREYAECIGLDLDVFRAWINVFAYFLSAISDTRVQLYSALVATLLNFPIAWFFSVQLSLGATSIVMGTCCALSLFAVLGPLATRRRLKYAVSE